MTITTRLTCFFLAMLLLVLLGFSISMYWVADYYLNQQVDDRLTAALNSICGMIETDAAGVEWEPGERRRVLEFPTYEDQLAWWIKDDKNNLIARSHDAEHTDITAFDNRNWQFAQRTIEATTSSSDDSQPMIGEASTKHAALIVSAAISRKPVQAAHWQLIAWLVGLSSVVWLAAFASARYVCRWALSPVRSMAIAAEQIDFVDPSQRLPSVHTHDEVGQLTQAFNAMLDRLQESFERQRRFTSDASHQLRTPLTAILGHVDVALRHDRTDTDYQAVLETIKRKGTHLSRVVESLLFLARSDREANLPRLVIVDLASWLPTYLTQWDDHPRHNDIQLDCDQSGCSRCVAQSELLAEILNILLENACKFSETGSPIVVSLNNDEDHILVSVADQGCGIDEGDLGNLFTPFVRSEQARQSGVDGVGLGLSIANRLAKTFGGDLTVTSERTRGSCFTLQLPKVSDDLMDD